MNVMDKVIREYINENFDLFFEVYIVPYLRKNHEKLFPELEKNLCLEHYNTIHKTNLTKNDIKLNPTNCWFCKISKDRP